MTKHLFTVYDTEFDLSDINDCHQFVEVLETFGKIHTWKLYDLLCDVDCIEGNSDGYQQFLSDIAQKFGQTIDTERELCLDNCAAKTILSTYSTAIDQYFRSNGAQPFVTSTQATQSLGDEIQQFTWEGFGTATEANYVPVQQVEIPQRKSHFVSKVLHPVRCPISGEVHIGNIDHINVSVNTVPEKSNKFGGQYRYVTYTSLAQDVDKGVEITDEIHALADKLLDEYMSGKGV